jgi:phosphomannomutase
LRQVALENGWLLIRASGTELLLRLTVEGESLKVARHILVKEKALTKKRIEDRKK